MTHLYPTVMDKLTPGTHPNPHSNGHHTPLSSHRRIHHSPFFWLAAVCILFAMIIYVVTNNLSTGPTGKPMPAVVP